MTRFRIVGPGRAGRSFARALSGVGWSDAGWLGRADDLMGAGGGVDVVLVTVPDADIAGVAEAIVPTDAVLLHTSGSVGLDVMAGHDRVGSVHPLMSMPDADIGAVRLADGCVFAVAGDQRAWDVVDALGGTAIEVADDDRALYHAAATVAANHLVALAAQVERLAGRLGVPASAYWGLMTTTLENVTDVGAGAALTGPAARGDWQTIQGHLDALPDQEQTLYRALARAAADLAGREWPADL